MSDNKLKFPNLVIDCHSNQHADVIIAEATKFGYKLVERNHDLIPKAIHLEPYGVIWCYNWYTSQELIADGHELYQGLVRTTCKGIRSHVEKLRGIESTDRLSKLTVQTKASVEVEPVRTEGAVLANDTGLSLWSKVVLFFTLVFNYLRGKR